MSSARTHRQDSDRTPESIRAQIMALVDQYYRLQHAHRGFNPVSPSAPVSGRVFDASDMQSLVDSALDFWLTTGRFNDAFQVRLAERVGARWALTVNSGSSANLVATLALTSPLVRDRLLQPGDEVIAAAAGFPTTINPAIVAGLTPVFVDVDIPTYNVLPETIEAAIGERTKAIVIAHTLGNPYRADEIAKIAEKHGLWLIEDCCDALGATIGGKHVGTFGDIGTLSFYPAHHITMGEGGAVYTTDPALRRAMEAFRDWGRDCYCEPGKDNTCGRRFDWSLGELPRGYDHKYVYSHLGYNLKITDMQAAVGLSQLDHLDDFVAARRHNFDRLKAGLKPFEEAFVLPEATPETEPSWFGFLLTVREGAPFTRDQLLRHLDAHRIGTRLLFAGNLVRQPYMLGRQFRVVGDLANSDRIMRQTFWIGVYPGLNGAAIDYMLEVIGGFCRSQGVA